MRVLVAALFCVFISNNHMNLNSAIGTTDYTEYTDFE